MKGKAIIFSAPSGAGKTTIVRHLLSALNNLAFSVSATSRSRRSYEVDGQDYYFISVEAFKNKINQNDFVEWEEVYPDHFYGTLKAEIEKIWSEGKHVIFDVDVVGGLNLKKYFGEKALSVFVQPPSLKVLEERLRSRKSESEEKIEMRLAKAKNELLKANEFDFILLNDNLEMAKQTAEKVVKIFLSA
ncbi:MAG: guanylate kinase [Bacteroidia bacterium]